MKNRIICYFLLFCAFFYSVSASASGREPGDIMLDVYTAQARIGQGERSAIADQARLLGEFGELIGSKPTGFWKEDNNARLLVSYVLSGGQLMNIRKLIRSHDVAPASEQMLRGAVSYMSGALDEARKALLSFDPREMNATFGAQIAYVQAVLLAEQDKPRASKLFDLARLLAPGGLLEEAALRRQSRLAVELGDTKQFTQLASQYSLRFRKSLYAIEFARVFVDSALKNGMQRSGDGVKELDHIAEFLPDELHRSLFLSLAREAVLEGEFDRTNEIIRMVADESNGDVAASARIKLYEGILGLSNNRRENGMSLLESVDSLRLDRADMELLSVARAFGRRIAAQRDDIATARKVVNAKQDETISKARRIGDEGDLALKVANQTLNSK